MTGRAAFAAPPLLAALEGKAIDPPQLDGLEPIVARCLDLDPAARPTAADVGAALRG